MAFAGKIICGVFEGKMMGQSLSTPDDAPVQTQQCVGKKSQQSATSSRE